jgi:hypothetical protein
MAFDFDAYFKFLASTSIPLWAKIVSHILIIAIFVWMVYALSKLFDSDEFEKRMAMAAAATVLAIKGNSSKRRT